jgi:hypothetical protein
MKSMNGRQLRRIALILSLVFGFAVLAPAQPAAADCTPGVDNNCPAGGCESMGAVWNGSYCTTPVEGGGGGVNGTSGSSGDMGSGAQGNSAGYVDSSCIDFTTTYPNGATINYMKTYCQGQYYMYINPAQAPALQPPADMLPYTWQAGDTWLSMGLRAHISPYALAYGNGIRYPLPGQTVFLNVWPAMQPAR